MSAQQKGVCRIGQIVALLEILETSAEAWWRLSSIIGQLFVRLETTFPPVEQIAPALGELQIEARRLDIRSADAQIARINEEVHSGNWRSIAELAIALRPLIIDLHLRISDELRDRFFLVISSDNVSYYRQAEPLFGLEVESKFSQMSEDISEAGKCLALHRTTAAVFHLMRVMELAVQKFGDRLNVPLVSELNWQNILDQINKAIRARDHHAPLTKAYAAAAAHLYNVKVAWRNEVMHPKQTYTDEEALAIFNAVQFFVRDLAGFL